MRARYSFKPTHPDEVLKDEPENEYDMLMAERDDSFMEKLKHIRRIAAIF